MRDSKIPSSAQDKGMLLDKGCRLQSESATPMGSIGSNCTYMLAHEILVAPLLVLLEAQERM
jgi:hypothetical protein